MRAEQMVELPVAVELPARLEAEVTAYLEQEVGWRRVPLDGPPSPALVLTQRPRPWPPSVLVLEHELAAVAPALAAPVLDVLVWPRDRDRLAGCVARLPGAPPAPTPPRVRVGGIAPGVGASTTALALAGLLAWSGRTVAAVGPDLPRLAGVPHRPGPDADELVRLGPAEAGREFARVAGRVRSVAGLWVLTGTLVPDGAGWPVDALVVDVGAAAAADVLIRPGDLPFSARVTRAGQAGRVPAGLPGSFVAALRARLGWSQ